MSFNMYLLVWTKIGYTEFNKIETIKKSYTTYSAMYHYMLPLISLIYFAKNHAGKAYLRDTLTLFFPMLLFDPSENIRKPKVF